MGHLPLPTSWLPEFTRGIHDDSSVNGKLRQKKTVEFRHKSWGLNSQSTDLTQQTGGIHLRRSSPTDIRTSTKRNRAGTPKIHLPEVDLQDLCCAMRNFEGSLPQIHRMPTSGRSHPWWTPAPKVFNLPTAFFWIHPDQTIQLWPLSSFYSQKKIVVWLIYPTKAYPASHSWSRRARPGNKATGVGTDTRGPKLPGGLMQRRCRDNSEVNQPKLCFRCFSKSNCLDHKQL